MSTNREDDRLFRHVAAARINIMESQQHALQSIYEALDAQCRSIASRLATIARMIELERASVDEAPKGGQP